MRLRPRHLRRYREIVEILTDYGFGAILAQLGISERLNLPRRIFRRKPVIEEQLSNPQRMRMAIVDLGPTFIKFGQILSTRSDMLPPDYIDELRLLQDQVPPAPWNEVREVIETELDTPLNDLFAHVDPVATASASLAQVHPAMLIDGEEVVIKVQRPGIERIIDLDLDILYDFAQLIQERTAFGSRYEAVSVAEEFANALKGELDFRREGRSADQFRENFSKEKQLYVPKVFWDYTSRRVMVQERIYGIKIDDISALRAAGYDTKRLAVTSARFILKEVLEDGYFHADPHPGNLLIMPGEVLGVLDFGTMGRLDTRDRVNMARMLILLVQYDAEAIVDLLMRMGIASYGVDRTSLTRDVKRLVNKYIGLQIQEIPVNEVIREVEPMVYKYSLRVPSDYLLLFKTIALMQGVGLALDPEFDMLSATRPYLGRLFRQLWSPVNWGPAVLRSVSDWGDLVGSFPRQTTRAYTRSHARDPASSRYPAPS